MKSGILSPLEGQAACPYDPVSARQTNIDVIDLLQLLQTLLQKFLPP